MFLSLSTFFFLFFFSFILALSLCYLCPILCPSFPFVFLFSCSHGSPFLLVFTFKQIEFLASRNDTSLFMYISHSKKRPHNMVRRNICMNFCTKFIISPKSYGSYFDIFTALIFLNNNVNNKREKRKKKEKKERQKAFRIFFSLLVWLHLIHSLMHTLFMDYCIQMLFFQVLGRLFDFQLLDMIELVREKRSPKLILKIVRGSGCRFACVLVISISGALWAQFFFFLTFFLFCLCLPIAGSGSQDL